MTELGMILVAVPLLTFVYTYAGYPGTLWLLAQLRQNPGMPEADEGEWPRISITVPAYNEAHQIAETVESLLALDYPAERCQILIVSDASTDGTDEIVRSYADRGVELLRMEERRGKTAAENAARERLTGDIIVNTDASIRIRPHSLKPLIRPLTDPDIGLASGRDISVSASESDANEGESGYVGYEMAIRDLETDVHGIVGASGCLYAIRSDLHAIPLPEHLSRDFAAALNTHERGYRAVSVPEAVCEVPRTPSLKHEYRRKVRTITRGMDTLHFKRALLNPFRNVLFAWMLFSHKVCRWLLPWTAVGGVAGLAVLAPVYPAAAVILALGVGILGLGVAGWAISDRQELPRVGRMLSFAVMGNIAAIHATLRFLQGDRHPVWEPTRRSGAETGEAAQPTA